jgi:uncharacterized protein (DUF1697 family)
MMKTSRTGGQLTYVALLRGINLSGHRIVKMDQLRKAFEGLGFEDVKTYIQSGNVVFKGPGTQNLVKRIEEKIVRQFGFPVPVVVKTSDEIGEIIRNNPLVKEKGIDLSKLHVTFLSCAPEKSALTTLEAFAAGPDQFRCSMGAIYLHCPNGYHATKLGNNMLGKMLKVGTTTRNWKTVNQLYEMTLG